MVRFINYSAVLIIFAFIFSSCAAKKDILLLRQDITEQNKLTESRLASIEKTMSSVDSLLTLQYTIVKKVQALGGTQSQEQRDNLSLLTARLDDIFYQMNELQKNSRPYNFMVVSIFNPKTSLLPTLILPRLETDNPLIIQHLVQMLRVFQKNQIQKNFTIPHWLILITVSISSRKAGLCLSFCSSRITNLLVMLNIGLVNLLMANKNTRWQFRNSNVLLITIPNLKKYRHLCSNSVSHSFSLETKKTEFLHSAN